ncbi:hypothetical protein CK203_039622 [Vitis vinifera]|uniref:Uncharacterized protein n=1 Tax=Vitis vinifera TaxID=29760 RepID=A0A438HFJ5_VITVI|nr:hypothetical protein CK203_039622 [Vitis vinifera]
MARLLLSGLPQGEAHDTHKHNIRTTATSHPDDRHILSGYVLSGSLTEAAYLTTLLPPHLFTMLPPGFDPQQPGRTLDFDNSLGPPLSVHVAASQSTPPLDTWHVQPSFRMCTWTDMWHVQPSIRTIMGLACDIHLPCPDVLTFLGQFRRPTTTCPTPPVERKDKDDDKSSLQQSLIAACQMKEISSSVEEASTVSNDSGSGKNNPQHWSSLWETSIGKDVHTFQKPFVQPWEMKAIFYWRETMERRQLESERKMQAMLQETRRLRE